MSSSSEVTVSNTQIPVDELFRVSISSSSDPPMDQWSSLFEIEVPQRPKVALFNEGLYDPGSGEICTKYIALSDSEVLRHVYYAYPGIKDPGIVESLLGPEKQKVFDANGQELYLHLCDAMKICPVKCFHRSLLEREIDLRYYCVNPMSVRAMCLALVDNTNVKRLDLTSNFLNEDACYHIGQLLATNMTLQELVLSRCKIGKEGLKRIVMRLGGRSMELLDLSHNEFGDSGFEYLADQIVKGAVINRLNLSNNGLGMETALCYSVALEGNNKTAYLDLSWNKMYTPKGINDLLRMLSESNVLVELNLSWNGLTTNQTLKRILAVPTLKILNLSNNRLSTASVRAICVALKKAANLQTLDLSNNPLTPSDALLLLEMMKERPVKLQNLLMENILVSKEFVPMLHEVLSLKYRANTRITHGKVIGNYTLVLPDLRDIVMKRLFYITDSSKKCSMDMPVYFLTKARHVEVMEPREFLRALKLSGAPIDDGLVDELSNAFPGAKTEKGGKTISLSKVAEFIKRIWPDKKPLLTPPPETAPVKSSKKRKRKK